MSKYRLFASILLLSLILAVACSTEKTPADSAESGAGELRIAFLSGKVQAGSDEATLRDARSGMRLGERSLVRTFGTESRCDLVTPNGSLIRLTGNTSLRLAELFQDGKLNVEKTGLELLAGSVLVKAAALTGSDRFQVRTETAVAGVRGTHFTVSIDEGGSTSVAVDSGKVSVTPRLTAAAPGRSVGENEQLAVALAQRIEVLVTPQQKVRIGRSESTALNTALGQALATAPADASVETLAEIAARGMTAAPAPRLAPVDAKDAADFRELRSIGQAQPGTSAPGQDSAKPAPQQPAGTLPAPSADTEPVKPGVPADERLPE